MNLEAVTVCIGYGDFLAETARHNAQHFSRWVVVTEPADEETREVCRRYSLDCLLSHDGRRGGEFAKGRLVERALHHLSRDGWRLHLDADVALPARTRMLLEAAHLDPACVYGCDRLLVRSWEEWQRLQASGFLHAHHDYHNRLTFPVGVSLGSRWVDHRHGYVPIGFFQLWSGEADHYRGTRSRPYPHQHGDACRSDVQFGLQWDRRHRLLLPELVVIHLESERAKLGANWKGRTTRRFGPPTTSPFGSQGCS